MVERLRRFLTIGPGSAEGARSVLQRVRWRFVLLYLVGAALTPFSLSQLATEASPTTVLIYALTAAGLAGWTVALYRTSGRAPWLDPAGPALVAALGITAGDAVWAFGPLFLALFVHSLYGDRGRVLRNAVLYVAAYQLAVAVGSGLAAVLTSQLVSMTLAAVVMAWVLHSMAQALARSDATRDRDEVLTTAGRELLRASDPRAIMDLAVACVAEVGAKAGVGPLRATAWRQDGDELRLVAVSGPALDLEHVELGAMPMGPVDHYLSNEPVRLEPEQVAEIRREVGISPEHEHGLAVPLSDGVVPLGLLFVESVGRLDDESVVALQRFADEVSLADRAVRHTELLAGVLDNSADGIVLVDDANRLTFVSPAVAELLGRPVTVGEHIGELLVIAAGEQPRPVTDITEVQHHWTSLQVRHVTDGVREVEVSARPVAGEGTVLNLRDVSEQRRLQAEISYRAFYDPVTGLPNRALFLDRLSHALARTARGGQPVAVALLDLDTFKGVNDRLGHLAGDQLLRHVGAQVAGLVREGDTVARLGGDEFALLFEDVDPHHLGHRGLLETILEAVRTPLEIDGHQVGVTASGGLAISTGSETAEQMLGAADLAMYEAKAHGRNTAVTFHAGMRTDLEERRALRDELEAAIAGDQLQVHYQPTLALGRETTTGVEALVRWQHPRRGLLAPDVFIPLAEQSGVILDLGRWVLDTACRDVAGWKAAGLVDDDFQLHVNLSVRQLTGDRLVADVHSALAATGLRPAEVVLEVTETALADNPELAEATLGELHRLGVAVAIDDFGTGYASFTYLRRFPVDIVKIDRSFVADITRGPHQAALARAIVRLATSLGMTTVAEGVETEAHRDLLTDWGCNLAQGWLWAPALPAGEVERWLADRRPGPLAVSEHVPAVDPGPARGDQRGTRS